jgi:predicted transcriptional regulator
MGGLTVRLPDSLQEKVRNLAEEEGAQPDELMEELLGQVGDEEPQEGDRRPPTYATC